MLGDYLAENASIAFYAGLNELYGIAFAIDRKLLIEYAELCLYLHYRTFVICKELLHWYHIIFNGAEKFCLCHFRFRKFAQIAYYVIFQIHKELPHIVFVIYIIA